MPGKFAAGRYAKHSGPSKEPASPLILNQVTDHVFDFLDVLDAYEANGATLLTSIAVPADVLRKDQVPGTVCPLIAPKVAQRFRFERARLPASEPTRAKNERATIRHEVSRAPGLAPHPIGAGEHAKTYQDKREPE